MYNFIGKYIRNKALKKYKPNKDASFKNIKDVSIIGFTYKIETPAMATDLLCIVEKLKENNLHYRGAVVVNSKQMLNSALDAKGVQQDFLDNITILSPSDITFFREPKKGVLDSFYSHNYDLFFNFNAMDSITLDCIVIGAKINYLVGMKNSSLIPNNMVLLGEKGVVLSNVEFFNQALHYLNVIECPTQQDYNEE